MLKPRYKNLTSMVEDFYGLLNDMEELNPKDPTLAKPVAKAAPAKQVVESVGGLMEGLNFAPSPFVRGDVAEAPHGGYHIAKLDHGHELTYAGGKNGSRTKNAHLGFHASAQDAQTIAGNHHLAQVRALGKPLKAESAPLSKYSGNKGMVDSFRVLAGLEERELSPWDPGIFGQTKTVQEMKEDYGMVAKPEVKAEAASSGYSAKAVKDALKLSHKLLNQQVGLREHLSEDVGPALATISEAAKEIAGRLRLVVEGAPDALFNKVTALADRHDRHAAIYARGKHPKLEATQELQAMVESVDPMDYLFIVRR